MLCIIFKHTLYDFDCQLHPTTPHHSTPPPPSPLPLTTPPHHSPSPLPLTTPPHHSPSPLPLTTPPRPSPIFKRDKSHQKVCEKPLSYVYKPLQDHPIAQNITSDNFLQKTILGQNRPKVRI